MRELSVERGHYFGYPLPDSERELVLSERFPYQGLQGFSTGDEYRDEQVAHRRLVEKYGDLEFVNRWVGRDGRPVILYRENGKTKHIHSWEVKAHERAAMELATMGCMMNIDYQAEIRVWKSCRA